MKRLAFTLAIASLLAFSTAAMAQQSQQAVMFAMGAATATVLPPSGMNFWYSADCITYTSSVCSTPSSGTTLTTWADRSGNANTATVGHGTCTYTASQINGKPAVVSANCGLALASAVGPGGGQWTMFVVVKVNSSSANNNFISCTGQSCPTYSTVGHQLIFSAGAGGGEVDALAAQDTSWHQLNVQVNNHSSGGTYAFRRDRATDGSGTVAFNMTAATNSISNEENTIWSDASFAEIIYYNTALTGTEITQVETYLNAKYGL